MDSVIGVVICFVGGGLAGGVAVAHLSTPDRRIIRGIEFVINNASYKCVKTNELLKGDINEQIETSGTGN